MSNSKPLLEFDIIERYIKPLANKGDASLALSDDAAVLRQNTNDDFVISQDAMVEDVHFLSCYPADIIAYRLFAANYSDIIAKGAKVKYYFLSIMLPEKLSNDAFLAPFFKGIERFLHDYGGELMGGDTTSSKSGLSLSLTAIGSCAKNTAVRRNGAKIGDDIFVTGTIGNAYLMLNQLNVYRNLFENNIAFASWNEQLQRDWLNFTNVALPIRADEVINRFANASCDVSDGLIADLSNICRASNVAAVLNFDSIPLPKHCKDNHIIAGGDDYQCLWTAPKKFREQILNLCHDMNINVSLIGSTIEKSKNIVTIINAGDATIMDKSYEHFKI